MALPPQHREGLLQPATGLWQGRSDGVLQAPGAIQPAGPGPLAGQDLRRSEHVAAAGETLHLLGRVRHGPVPEPLPATRQPVGLLTPDPGMERLRSGDAVAGPLASVGLLLGAIPLLITVVSSLISAWRAPVDPRFTGLRSRLLISYLILGGPLVRSIERYKWRRKLLGAKGATKRPLEKPLKSKFPLQRTYGLNFWSDQGIERDIFLQDVIHQLQERKYFVNIQNGWERWDIRVQQGLWAWCYVYSATEIHGGYERLHRLKLKLKLSGLAKTILGMWAALFSIVLLCKSLMAVLVMLIPGTVLIWTCRSQMKRMARSMADVVTIAGQKFTLVPTTNR